VHRVEGVADIPEDVFPQIAALTTAAVETITQSAADITPVSLLGLLLCFLSDSQRKGAGELMGVVCILSAVLPHVPFPVLHMRVEDLAAVFGTILTDNAASDSMLRPIVTCIKSLLVAQVRSLSLFFFFFFFLVCFFLLFEFL
jgi:hypothetical protein